MTIDVVNTSLAAKRINRVSVVDADLDEVIVQTIHVVNSDLDEVEVFRFFNADFTIGPQSSVEIGSTGNYANRRALVAVVTGGTGPFTYAWSDDDPDGIMSFSSATSSSTFAQSTTFDGEPGSGQVTANVTLQVTDTATSFVASITKSVTLFAEGVR